MKSDAPSFMQKKFIYTLLASILMVVSSYGQRHEIGAQLGMSNLVGDIGRTNYILQKPSGNFSDYGVPFYGSILYRMNFNPYQTVRFNLGYSHIQFIDNLAKEQYRRNRNLAGTNSVAELDVLFEYNFFPVNDEQKSLLSPYIFGGFGALLASTPQLVIEHDFRRDSNGEALAPSDAEDFETAKSFSTAKNVTFAIPFGVGLKYKFNYNWALFGEFMFRPTFSDSIDHSQIDEKSIKEKYNKDLPSTGSANKSLLQETPYRDVADARAAVIIQNREIGNINSKDWVNTISLGLSYSFGRPPCYCD